MKDTQLTENLNDFERMVIEREQRLAESSQDWRRFEQRWGKYAQRDSAPLPQFTPDQQTDPPLRVVISGDII
jgi:hypothetical protein